MSAIDGEADQRLLIKHGAENGAVALVRRAGVRIVVNDDVARFEFAELLQEMSNREGEASSVSRYAGRLRDHVAVAIEEPHVKSSPSLKQVE